MTKTPEKGVQLTVITFADGSPTPYMIAAASASVQRNEGKPAFEAFRHSESLGEFSNYDDAREAIDLHPLAYE